MWINVDYKFFGGSELKILAGLMEWSEKYAMGTMNYLWKFSQEKIRLSGSEEEICDWAGEYENRDNFITALLRSGLIEINENDPKLFDIVGNKKHVKWREQQKYNSSLGVEAKRKKADSLKVAESLGADNPPVNHWVTTGLPIDSPITSTITKGIISPKGDIAKTDVICDRTPYAAFLSIWNSHRGSLAKSRKITDSRKRKIKSRLREEPSLDYWISLVKRMADSRFCRENKFATLDWLIANDNNHLKVAEGKYDNPDEIRKTSPEDIAARAERCLKLREEAKKEKEKNYGL